MTAAGRPVVAALFASLLAAMILAAAPSRAGAQVVLKSGPTVFTSQANCFPEAIYPAYSQQTTPGGGAGTEPKVGDVFYLSVTVEFLSSFDCAADFASVLVTLPPNVLPAVGGSLIPICRRFGKNNNGQTVFDPRATANCPKTIAYNPTTRQFSLRPVDNPILPDVGGPAGSFWFMGIRAPQEAQEYPSIQLLVPVTASATMNSQNVSYFVCAVGTSCATATVPLTVGSAPPPSTPTVSLPANVTTSKIGARIPFAINAGAATQYVLRIDAATDGGFTTGRPCGSLPFTTPGIGLAYQGPFNSEVQFGDLQEGGIACNLTPNTTYFVKVCTANAIDRTTTIDCRTTSFTTSSEEALPSTLSRLSLAGGTIRAGKAPKLRLSLSAASRVTLLVKRSVRSCKSGRCKTTYKTYATTSESRPAGTQVWKPSRIGGKRWQRGRYRLTLQPAGGAVSKTLSLRVR